MPVIIKKYPEVKKYLRSLMPKSLIGIAGIESPEGVWLLESDNKKYYKILFFKN